MSKIQLNPDDISGVNLVTVQDLINLCTKEGLNANEVKLFIQQASEDSVIGVVTQPTGIENEPEEFCVSTTVIAIQGNIYLMI